MTIARDFTEWASGVSPAGIPDPVRRQAQLHALDGLGTALAAARMDAAPFAVPVARSLGAGTEASILGSAARASAPAAAFANGVLLHSLDFDDTHTSGLVHSTAMTLPAALAVAQREDRSGADLVRALVLGHELAGRLGAAAPHGFHARGFHATAVCGTFTAAFISSVLAGLTAGQTVSALGIAGSQSSGSMEFLATGASTKQIHPGWLSLAGVVAAGLAARGALGPDTIIEGERGLYALFSAAEPDLASVTAGLGDSWQIENVAIKPYPACHLMHRVLDVGRHLRPLVDLGQVRDVLVRIPADSVPIVCSPEDIKRRPRSPYEAKFSVQWSLAAMLVDGEIGVDTYRGDRIDRGDVHRLSSLVRYEALHGDLPAAEEPGDVTVWLADGSCVRMRSDDAACAGADTGLRDEVLAKFRLNAGGSEQAAGRVAAAVLDLDAAADLSELAAALDGLAAEWGGNHE
jgi:2-methylcitrate dehydratase PrpD